MNCDKMIETNKQRTQDTHDKVLKTLNEMLKNNENITYYSVAKKTGVSRSFLYKDEEIKTFIDKYKTSKSTKKIQSQDAKDVIINAQKQKIKELEKYQKENENYKEKYDQLLKENKALKEQLKNSYDY